MSTALGPSPDSMWTEPPALSLSKHCDDDEYRVVVSGELDLMTAPTLDHALQEAIRSDRPTVTIDLDLVSFCDCAGMRVLTIHHRALAESGRLLILDRPSPPVLRLAAMTGLDTTLRLSRRRPDHTRPTPGPI